MASLLGEASGVPVKLALSVAMSPHADGEIGVGGARRRLSGGVTDKAGQDNRGKR
jgi:hypothetical protein